VIKALRIPEIKLHNLRHKCASILLENNAEMNVISDLPGHSTYSTTIEIYSNMLSKKELPADIMQKKFGSISQ
jgi:site-specific recombinase XerD